MKLDKLHRLIERSRKLPFNRNRHVLIRKMQLTSNATVAERAMHKKLIEWGYPVQFQKGFVAGGVIYVADFYIPHPHRLVIEVDGYSHMTPEGVLKDARRDAYFRRRGFRVLHITNENAIALTREQFDLEAMT